LTEIMLAHRSAGRRSPSNSLAVAADGLILSARDRQADELVVDELNELAGRRGGDAWVGTL
jgi:hypothetical protein